jgi:hypothetical protein
MCGGVNGGWFGTHSRWYLHWPHRHSVLNLKMVCLSAPVTASPNAVSKCNVRNAMCKRRSFIAQECMLVRTESTLSGVATRTNAYALMCLSQLCSTLHVFAPANAPPPPTHTLSLSLSTHTVHTHKCTRVRTHMRLTCVSAHASNQRTHSQH